VAGFDAENGEPLQASWNREALSNVYGFILKPMGFSQSLSRVLAGGAAIR